MTFCVLNDGTLVRVEEPTGGGHTWLSPSAADRWVACPGSLAIPAQPSMPSAAADEGTAAHMLLEYVLRAGITESKPSIVSRVRVRPGVEFEATPEMKGAVYAVLRELSGANTVESEVQVTPIRSLRAVLRGTVDVLATWAGDKPWVKVIDLKYGRHPVPADANQLQLYLIGALAKLSEEWGGVPENLEIETVIVQPRAPGGPVRRRVWTLTAARDLAQTWLARLGPYRAMHARWDGKRFSFGEDGTLHTGPHCRYCPHIMECHIVREDANAAATAEFAVADLAAAAAKLPGVKAWIEAVEDALRRTLRKAPDAIPTHKLVRGAGRRQWSADSAAIADYVASHTGQDVYALKSVAAVERELPKSARDGLSAYYARGAASTLLVSATDPRPPLDPADDFDSGEDNG